MIPKSLRICALAATLCATALVPVSAADPELQTVAATDKTASVAIPAGWTMTRGMQGFIALSGPHGEVVNLGVLVIGKNASGSPGQATFALPYSASLRDKFVAIVQGGAAKAGQPIPQIMFAAETPMKLPMCSQFLGGWTAGSNARKFEGVLCSLAPDVLGLYKNLVFLANVPASLAAQDRPVVEKIAASYRVTPAMFKQMLAPYTATPAMPAGGAAGGGTGSMPGMAPYRDPTNADCFDYNNIRESPPWEVPMHCGGYKPG